LLSELTGELALFAAAGYTLFALGDLAVDLVYFARSGWRALTIYTRYPRSFASQMLPLERPGRMVVLIPA
jgi:adsorption protein B